MVRDGQRSSGAPPKRPFTICHPPASGERSAIMLRASGCKLYSLRCRCFQINRRPSFATLLLEAVVLPAADPAKILSFSGSYLLMTTLADRPNTALVVIDLQNEVVAKAYRRDEVLDTVNTLIARARSAKVPVVWIRHADEGLKAGSEAWQIVAELVPAAGEAAPVCTSDRPPQAYARRCGHRCSGQRCPPSRQANPQSGLSPHRPTARQPQQHSTYGSLPGDLIEQIESPIRCQPGEYRGLQCSRKCI